MGLHACSSLDIDQRLYIHIRHVKNTTSFPLLSDFQNSSNVPALKHNNPALSYSRDLISLFATLYKLHSNPPFSLTSHPQIPRPPLQDIPHSTH